MDYLINAVGGRVLKPFAKLMAGEIKMLFNADLRTALLRRNTRRRRCYGRSLPDPLISPACLNKKPAKELSIVATNIT